MKKSVRILAMLLTVLLAASLLCACQSTADKYAALAGTWIAYEQETEDQVLALLESIDLYEEEIALVDMSSLQYALVFEFDTEGNLRQTQPIDETKALVREFYEGMFNSFYENRTTLDSVYENDFGAMSQDEFYQFYADLYGYDTFEALLNDFVELAYNYGEWPDMRNGTFTFDGNNLSVVDTIEDDTYLIGYKLDGNTLTLTYIDGTEVYTRVQ